MNTVIKTAPAIEPVSVSELKEHLRLDSPTFADSMTPYQSIAPGAHVQAASYSLKGTGVSVIGKRALVRLNAGDCSAGTVTVKVQESDTDSDSAYTDWSTAFTAVTDSNDNQIHEKEYTGTKAYIRAVATVATGTCEFAVSVEVQSATHAEDTLLGQLITAARQYAEAFTGRALITQTWTGYLDEFPDGDYFELPYPPLQTVSSIKYREYDWAEAADWETWDDDYYIGDTISFHPRVVLAYGASWPSFTAYPIAPIAVEYVVGYGVTAASVPEAIRRAICLYAATLYEYREDLISGVNAQSIPAPYTSDSLLWPYRVEV